MPTSSTDAVLLQRVERVIRVLSPALNLLLAVGERVSHALEPDDPDYAPPRMARDGESAPRGLRTPPHTARAETHQR